jgi:small ligand-binding sensory domain FIST
MGHPANGRGDGVARFGNGLAQGEDLAQAAERAAVDALATLDGRPPDLACVFVCGADPDEVTAAAGRAYDLLGPAAAIGCSAHGVLGAGESVELLPAVSVWAGVLPGARVRTFHLDTLRSDEGLAVLGMPDLLDDDHVGLLLADPWTFPADGFVERSNDALPGLPLVGGLAIGPQGAGSTRLFRDGTTYSSGAVGAVIGGDIDVVTVVSQGCRPIGPNMIVTKAEANELIELAGTPATEKLQEILRDLAPEDRELALGGMHIGVAMDEYAEHHERGDFLIRGVIGVDPDRQAVAIGDVVDVGRTVRFQVRDATAADEDLVRVLSRFRGDIGDVEAALLFSCNGRGRAMFANADHDVRAVGDQLGIRDVAGFFAAGEIGPVGGRNHLHGFTASILAFGAADA